MARAANRIQRRLGGGAGRSRAAAVLAADDAVARTFSTACSIGRADLAGAVDELFDLWSSGVDGVTDNGDDPLSGVVRRVAAPPPHGAGRW